MPWRVESRSDAGKWVAYDGSQWTSDPDTHATVRILRANPQPLTPVGPFYEPTGPDDDVALFLAAMGAVPAPAVTGDPPALPTLPPHVEGVTY